jgi:hypothetical protein
MEGLYEHGNEHTGSIKVGNVLVRWATIGFSVRILL